MAASEGELDRIRREYARRERDLPADQYSLVQPHVLFAWQQRQRELIRLLALEGLWPVSGRKILDIGCGEGDQLMQLLEWGASRGSLAGIDLLTERVARARMRLGTSVEHQVDLQVGDASNLPWPNENFDLIHQNTVFTSVLAFEMRKAIAREIVRVLKPGGVLIWYDFFVDNPRNPAVRRVGRAEIHALFSGCTIRLTRTTLAPPVARRLVPVSWIGALMLQKLQILNTHYIAAIRKPYEGDASRR